MVSNGALYFIRHRRNAYVVGSCSKRDAITSQPANDMLSMGHQRRYYKPCNNLLVCAPAITVLIVT